MAIGGLLGGLALLILAAMTVLAMRWMISLAFMQDFLAAYPGEYPLPEGSPVGFPAWLQWQHFFNTFLIVLIIRYGPAGAHRQAPVGRSGRRVVEERPGKISLTLWFHQSLDVLWLVNGLLFIVLLFATGHWVRIVPTSWEVFPNALSAALQYVSLDWPTENGWVNYNSLQQLAYFTTVFVAAPLAVITGVRMSGLWPKNAKALNRAYPVEWARAVHFPVMLYFVAFIIVHVALVFATGALRNLNHMYGGSDAVNWVGFWIFVGSMVDHRDRLDRRPPPRARTDRRAFGQGQRALGARPDRRSPRLRARRARGEALGVRLVRAERGTCRARGRMIERAPGRSSDPTRSARPRTTATGSPAALPFTRSAADGQLVGDARHRHDERPALGIRLPPQILDHLRRPPAPMAQSVWPSRHARPRVSETSTPSRTPSRSRSPAASARAEASGSTGSSSTVPCGVFDASTPAAADTMPRRFSTIRVVAPDGVVRVATTRTVSAVMASSRSAASTKRPSALETILDVTTRMSPSCERIAGRGIRDHRRRGRCPT